MAEMDPLGRKPGGDDRQQIGAVDRQMRRAVKRLAHRVECRLLQGAAVVPAPLMGAARAHRLAVEPRPEAEPIEDARGIGAHVDAAADLGQPCRLLVDIDRKPGPAQRQRRAEAADPGPDHRNPEWLRAHFPADPLREAARRRPSDCNRPPGEDNRGVMTSFQGGPKG